MNLGQQPPTELYQNPFLVCNQCSVTASNIPNSDLGCDQITQTYIITINSEESYCLRCLQEKVKSEMREASLLQQRYIYQKQFQSSFQQQDGRKKSLSELQFIETLKLNQQIAKLHIQDEQIQKSLTGLREQTNLLKQKIFSFEVEQEKFWEGINKIERRTNKVEEKSINTKFDKQEQKDLLQSLSKISIIHLFSDIVIDDSLALVQGMAMGKRTENTEVSWQQVAVGLGHLLIAYNFLNLKYSYQSRNIEEIKVKGMQSQIILRSKKRLTVLNSKENEKQFGQLLEILLIQIAFLSQHILEAEKFLLLSTLMTVKQLNSTLIHIKWINGFGGIVGLKLCVTFSQISNI